MMKSKNDTHGKVKRTLENNKKNKKTSLIPLLLIFLTGLAIMLYPFISQYIYYRASRVVVSEFKEAVSKLPDSETERRIGLAIAYNSTLKPNPNGISDPFTFLQKEGVKEYARMLEVNEQIGYVSIPSILLELPVYAGTSETVLQKGAGHLEGTSLPVGGLTTHTVITAHRGLPTARLFTDLNKVKKGDVFYIRNLKEILAYRVYDIKTVEPTDLTSVRIEEGKDIATLLTCTPYMINSHRLVVTGERIQYTKEAEEIVISSAKSLMLYRLLFIISFIILIILISILIVKRNRNTKKRI